MEELAVAFGHKVMHVGVDPVENPRALALYERLGYIYGMKLPLLLANRSLMATRQKLGISKLLNL